MDEIDKLMELLSKKSGCSVTQRIKQVKQPLGGYINPKSLTTVSLGEGIDTLNPDESTHAVLVGIAVDYLTRFMLGASAEDAFQISMMGAKLIKEEKKAKELMAGVKGLDKTSIVNAVKLCGFDVCYRAGIKGYRPVDEIMPDTATVENIITMVNRALKFFETYGPKVLDGFTFEGGYTSVVITGDGDFTTKDTLWDFKVSKAPIKKNILYSYLCIGAWDFIPFIQNLRIFNILEFIIQGRTQLHAFQCPIFLRIL